LFLAPISHEKVLPVDNLYSLVFIIFKVSINVIFGLQILNTLLTLFAGPRENVVTKWVDGTLAFVKSKAARGSTSG
jgi:hypothetical protein